MTDGVKRTVVAQQAIELGEALNVRLREMSVGANVPKRLEVVSLDAESTRGGELARQSIVLTPIEAGARGAVMCGWLDVSNREAEIRDYALVDAQFNERYHIPFDVERDDYERLVGALHEILNHQDFVFSRVKAAASADDAANDFYDEAGGGWMRMGLIVAVGCLVGLGIAYLFGG